MKVKVIALYPFWSEAVGSQPGVRTRVRRGRKWTQVTCSIEERDSRHLALPQWTPPPTMPSPLFRFHLEIERHERQERKSVVLVLQRAKDADVDDPEQRIMAPIFNSDARLVYEFERAEVVFVTAKGLVEVRELAIDPTAGDVGTHTKYTFHGRYAKLAARCSSHLGGTLDLYPPPLPAPSRKIPVPKGKPNLHWQAGSEAPSTK